MDLRKIYEYALQREIEGKNFFEQNAKRLKHGSAIGIFQKLAEEEQKHIEFIQSQIKALDKGQKGDIAKGTKMEKDGFFSQRADSEKIEQTTLEAMTPDLPILRMAYLIEHDFAEFYENMSKKAEGKAKSILEMLANWERSHEKLFKNMHDKAFEEYVKMPWGG